MRKLTVLLIVTVLVSGLGFVACGAPTEIGAPSATPPAEQPAAPPSQPAAPPSQPEQPAAPPSQPEQPAAPPAAKQLSFEAATYTNTEYGFSIQYPKKWSDLPDVRGGTKVAAFGIPAFIPGVTVSVRDADAPLTKDWIVAADTAEGSTDVGVTSDITPTKLNDGTDALQYTGKFTNSGYGFVSYAISVDKGGKRIRATVWTIDQFSPYDPELFPEIAHTLAFK